MSSTVVGEQKPVRSAFSYNRPISSNLVLPQLLGTPGAVALAQCLAEQNQQGNELASLTRRFHKQLAKVNDMAWMMATSEDLRWSTTEGGQTSIINRPMQWYIERVQSVTINNPKALEAFLEVLHLVKPPTTLFQPNILASVLKHLVKGIGSRAASKSVLLSQRSMESIQ